MGLDIMVGVIGVLLITLALIGFKKEMTLLKIECEGTKIENKVTNMQFSKISFNN